MNVRWVAAAVAGLALAGAGYVVGSHDGFDTGVQSVVTRMALCDEDEALGVDAMECTPVDDMRYEPGVGWLANR